MSTTYSGRSARYAQACRQQKAAIRRHTPNESEAAELIGVNPSTVHRWGDLDLEGYNMPLAAASLHPAGLELLEQHAFQLGYTLTPIDRSRNDGQITDEMMAATASVGRLAEQIREALGDARSPGRVDSREARDIRTRLVSLQEELAHMSGELDEIIEDESH